MNHGKADDGYHPLGPLDRHHGGICLVGNAFLEMPTFAIDARFHIVRHGPGVVGGGGALHLNVSKLGDTITITKDPRQRLEATIRPVCRM